jgi:hypothetical protein
MSTDIGFRPTDTQEWLLQSLELSIKVRIRKLGKTSSKNVIAGGSSGKPAGSIGKHGEGSGAIAERRRG